MVFSPSNKASYPWIRTKDHLMKAIIYPQFTTLNIPLMSNKKTRKAKKLPLIHSTIRKPHVHKISKRKKKWSPTSHVDMQLSRNKINSSTFVKRWLSMVQIWIIKTTLISSIAQTTKTMTLNFGKKR